MKISIITVCYNSEKTLQRTINSIKNQNLKNLEYIFIDGCSEDKTLEIINKNKVELENQGIKVIIISEPDSGLYNAMNKGIRLAKGEVISILNSDDYYLDGTLKIVENEILDTDILIGDMCVFTKEKQKKVKSSLQLNNRMTVCHPATFVKKEIYDKYGAFDENFKIAADYDFILRCYKKNVKIKLINKILVMMDGTGVSNQKKYLKQIVYENNKVRTKNKLKKMNNIIYFWRDYFSYIYRISGVKDFINKRLNKR